ILVVLAVLMLDRLRLDDPVGAIPVHLVCGIWGTLAVGIFGDLASTAQLMSQLIGIVTVGAFSFSFAFALFYVLKITIGVRVSSTEEIEGLDIHEHSMRAYPDFNNDISYTGKRVGLQSDMEFERESSIEKVSPLP